MRTCQASQRPLKTAWSRCFTPCLGINTSQECLNHSNKTKGAQGLFWPLLLQVRVWISPLFIVSSTWVQTELQSTTFSRQEELDVMAVRPTTWLSTMATSWHSVRYQSKILWSICVWHCTRSFILKSKVWPQSMHAVLSARELAHVQGMTVDLTHYLSKERPLQLTTARITAGSGSLWGGHGITEWCPEGVPGFPEKGWDTFWCWLVFRFSHLRHHSELFHNFNIGSRAGELPVFCNEHGKTIIYIINEIFGDASDISDCKVSEWVGSVEDQSEYATYFDSSSESDEDPDRLNNVEL